MEGSQKDVRGYRGVMGTIQWDGVLRVMGVLGGVCGDLQGFCAAPPTQMVGVMWGLRDVIRAS